jgi:hypothetical protein
VLGRAYPRLYCIGLCELRRLILEYEAPRFTWDSLFESASSSTHLVSDNRHLPLPRSYIAYASHIWESLFELEQFTLYDSHAASDLPLRQWRNGSSSSSSIV